MVETLTHGGWTITLVRTDPPGTSPARWYQARKYDVQWYDVFLSRSADDRGDKIGGVERFRTPSRPAPSTGIDLRGPRTARQYKQLRWRYYTDNYAPATSMAYATRRAALEDLLRSTAQLSGAGRADIKLLSGIG